MNWLKTCWIKITESIFIAPAVYRIYSNDEFKKRNLKKEDFANITPHCYVSIMEEKQAILPQFQKEYKEFISCIRDKTSFCFFSESVILVSIYILKDTIFLYTFTAENHLFELSYEAFKQLLFPSKTINRTVEGVEKNHSLNWIRLNLHESGATATYEYENGFTEEMTIPLLTKEQEIENAINAAERFQVINNILH